MNPEKKFFEEHSEGQVFYSASHGGEIQQLAVKIIENKNKETYFKYSERFYSSSIPWRKSVFGKQDFCTSDSANRRLYVWRVNLSSGILWILSGGNGRGTTYEWYSEANQYDQLHDEILDFLLEKYELKDELSDL